MSEKQPEKEREVAAAVQAPEVQTMATRITVNHVNLKLKGVYVKDNREALGSGEVYLVTAVVDDISPEPYTVEVKTFKNVKDGSYLPIGSDGLLIYRNPEKRKLPELIDIRVLVAESDEDLRDAGALITEVMGDNDVKTALDALKKAIAAGNPTAGLVAGCGETLVKVFGKVLKAKKDDQILYYANTITDIRKAINQGDYEEQERFCTLKYRLEIS